MYNYENAIEIRDLTVKYDGFTLDNVSFDVAKGTIMGFIGQNGAGKTTTIKALLNIINRDGGTIKMLGLDNLKDEVEIKQHISAVFDELPFQEELNAKNINTMMKNIYTEWSTDTFNDYLDKLALPSKKKIGAFSKGMKKQLSIIIGICAQTPYLFCDETFDGLDPVMRQAIKSLFIQEMENRPFTPVILSHNLRELEDISDHIGLLHKGGVLLSQDLDDLKCNLTKIQCVIPENYDEKIQNTLLVLKMQRKGKLLTMTVRGDSEKVVSWMNELNPIYCESIPLSLEEIFISETEVAGYDINSLIN
mgnify:CR=1 FL=1